MQPFPITPDDALQISSWNALASVRLTVRGRVRDREGRVRGFEFPHVPASNRTITSTVEPLGDGELLHVTVFVSSAAPIVGQTFVRLQIVRGVAASAIALATLAADYVTAVQPLAWPGSPVKRSVDGPGALRSITGTDPAAGVEITEAVPTGARWRLISLLATFVTSATAANREAALGFEDGANFMSRSPAGVGHVASTTIRYNWYHAAQRSTIAQDATVTIGLPIGAVLAAHRFRTQTTNLQAGDEWSAPAMLVEEWLEGAA